MLLTVGEQLEGYFVLKSRGKALFRAKGGKLVLSRKKIKQTFGVALTK